MDLIDSEHYIYNVSPCRSCARNDETTPGRGEDRANSRAEEAPWKDPMLTVWVNPSQVLFCPCRTKDGDTAAAGAPPGRSGPKIRERGRRQQVAETSHVTVPLLSPSVDAPRKLSRFLRLWSLRPRKKLLKSSNRLTRTRRRRFVRLKLVWDSLLLPSLSLGFLFCRFFPSKIIEICPC